MVSGSAPLTDSQSLFHSVSKRFDIKEMGSQPCDNRFDIEACCVTMLPSRKKGESLVLPNLKLKQSEGFKFDSQIENEAREIFRTWTDEVVQDFLGSLEERWEWQWMLTAGDFLSLRHIRDQLPQELVDAYDKFQEQVDKYLSPVQARKAFEKEEKRVEEEEERKYAKSTIEDLTRLCMKVDAPVELVRKAVKMAGFTNNMGCPRLIKLLIALEDTDIIKWYAGVGRRWLDFFCRCHNFKMVKSVVTYHLRFSCILTLAEKHESTKREAIKHYTKDFKNCLNVNPSVEDKWVPGMGAIHESLNRKCLPLCSHHINDLYMGNITLQDIDCTAFVDVD
ncbi:nuclear intron maturase 3 [Quercus suber]|uniref:Nuclear intron maturase 3 n=1 Tax=Quercus suber TaxID=58331 RepID=A0AAW0MA85_QUESU